MPRPRRPQPAWQTAPLRPWTRALHDAGRGKDITAVEMWRALAGAEVLLTRSMGYCPATRLRAPSPRIPPISQERPLADLGHADTLRFAISPDHAPGSQSSRTCRRKNQGLAGRAGRGIRRRRRMTRMTAPSGSNQREQISINSINMRLTAPQGLR